MKKVIYFSVFSILLLVSASFFIRDYIGIIVISYFLEPAHDFADKPVPEAPEYNNPDHWAALPERNDFSDVQLVAGVDDEQAERTVDVFFIHPTTYIGKQSWNQRMDDNEANDLTDAWVMRDQASVFNQCCRIYAPRYRQATLYSFQDKSGSGEKALGLAYEDVKSAFLYFLKNYSIGRPFIIASHSQGSRHADRLLREEIIGRGLLSQMIVAYLIGFSIDGSNGVPVCEKYDQLNCQITWNSSTRDAVLKLAEPEDVCVNPLSWTTNEDLVGADQNLGSVTFASEGGVELNVADAQCSEGSLFVSEVETERFNSNMPFGPGNYHMYDYSFYYMNIRKNVQDRINEYLSRDVSESASSDIK